MNDKLSRQNCVLYVCGIIPVVWLALLAAPLLEGGLGTLLEGFGTALENPFQIVWCDKSLKTLLIFLMLYGLGIGIYVSNERVYKRREEQGSARWGNPLSIAKRYQQSGNANKLLTQQMALGLDGRKHRRNLNVLICGGSGAGKTRYYAKPNIMQASSTGKQTLSMVVGCRSMSTLSWTNLRMSHCRMILTSSLPPCAAGRFPSASSSKTWPS